MNRKTLFKCLFVLTILTSSGVAFKLGYDTGKNTYSMDDFRAYANEMLLNSNTNNISHKRIIDDFRFLSRDLMKKAYYEGDLYNYTYYADGFEEILYFGIRHELMYLGRFADRVADEHVFDVIESHLKAYIIVTSVLDSEHGSNEKRVQRLACLLREYKLLNERRYSNLIKTCSMYHCCGEAVMLIDNLDKRQIKVHERGSPESVSSAREKYLRERNSAGRKESSDDDCEE